MEMMVSMLLSFLTSSVASSNWAMGACCPILLKVPACLSPRRSSTCLINEVFVASELPVMMNALLVSLGRHSSKYFLTLSGP